MSDAVPAAAVPRRRALLLLLALVICAAVALRVWYLPAPGRLDGESRSVANVESRLGGRPLRHPDLEPLAWVPQLLTIRLADRLYDLTGVEAIHASTAKGRLTRHGLYLARAVVLAPAIAGMLLLYAIGRRLHSPAVALVAVLVLAFSPRFVDASVSQAPEMLVLAFAALALWLALRALDGPSPGRFALVGAALGAAAAAQPIGGAFAAPVLLGLIPGGRAGRRGAALALGITLPVAAVVWWLLTPPWDAYAAALAEQRWSDAVRAGREMSSRFTVAVFGLLLPLRETAHGKLLGSLALLGAAGQAFRCLFLVDPGPDRGPRLMVLAAAPAFLLGMAWWTPLYRESSFVPLLLFSSLYAAVMLGILWDGLGEMLPALRAAPVSTWASAAAFCLAAALAVPPGWSYVRSRAVGSTIGEALVWLRLDRRGGGPPLVFVEEAALGGSEEAVMELAAGTGLQVVPRLAAVDEERLARADGEVFLRSRLEGEDGAFYRARGRAGSGRQAGVQAGGQAGGQFGRRREVESSVLWRRGPDLVAVRRPAAGPARPVELPLAPSGGDRVGAVPAAPGAAFVSLVLRLPPTKAAAPPAPTAALDGAAIELVPAGRSPDATYFFSERLPAAPAPRRLEIEPPPWASDPAAGIAATLYLWP